MATRTVLLPVLIAVLLGLAESPARAIALDDGCINDPVCRQHYDTALELFQDGRYEAALSEFQAAYEQRQMPWLLVNIGRTLHRLGRLKEAIAHYERYQQSGLGTDPETNQKAREYLAQARLLLAQAPKTPGSADSATAAGGQESVPRYKKWWFWTAIGGGVAVVAIVGIGLGVGLKSEPSPPPSVQMTSMLPAGVVVYRPSF